MAKLAAWSIDGKQAGGASQQSEPERVGRSHIGLERYFEDWIANDVTLIAEGLTLVGRQISIDDGRLDLLAIDSQDRWVVIEIKPGVLDSGALAQALYYTSSIARLSADELYGKLEPRLGDFGDAERLSASVKQQLAGDGEGREIAVLLVGAGIHSGLERMNEFLGRFGVPISVVSFEVFELDGGPQFDRFVNMALEAGLAVQPQRASVRIAPPTNRTRFLMYAQPRAGGSGGELGIWVGPKQFAEFFPHVDEETAIDALGRYDDGAFLAGEALDKRLDQIERFLTAKVQEPDVDGG